MSVSEDTTIIRRGRPEDLEPMLGLLAHYERPRSYFEPFYLKDPTYRPEHSWVVEQGGRLLAHLRVFDREIRIDGAKLRVAAIGNVITAPDQRGRGHAGRLRGAQGAGGELGHVTIQATGPRCACGNRGCLEALASGSAIGRRAREVSTKHPSSALGRLAARKLVLGEDVTRLARQGDELALSVLEEAGTWLGVGLASFINVFNPEVIVAGGGVMEAGELILGAARREMYLRARSPSGDLAEVKVAALGPDSGVLGAAALAREASSGEYLLNW
jgi:hypothetical protein